MRLERPSAARVYDYYLGGSHNYAVDRALGRRVIGLRPDIPRIARANRSFLRRAIEYLVGAGMRQFLDLGSGIPTAGNVHEIAQRFAPAARVAYVDIDPIAVAHSRTVVAGDDRVAVVHADLCAADLVLSDPDVRALLHLDQPVAILMTSVLHFLADADEPRSVVAQYRDATVPGSYLVVSHAARRGADPDPAGAEILAAYDRAGATLTPRTEADLLALFDGYELVEPGLVALEHWRPEPFDAAAAGDAARTCFRAGVGYQP
jgi:SAM-dependent methyltransferase